MSDSNAMPVFKKATLEDNSIGTKKRAWKSLKQILATERTLQWPDNAVTCKCVDHLPIQFRQQNRIFSISKHKTFDNFSLSNHNCA